MSALRRTILLFWTGLDERTTQILGHDVVTCPFLTVVATCFAEVLFRQKLGQVVRCTRDLRRFWDESIGPVGSFVPQHEPFFSSV
jgi:hypothetical protein